MITLYTTHCPRCRVLKAKLDGENIDYEVVEGEEAIREKGFVTTPLLEVDVNNGFRTVSKRYRIY